jgi:hypothetical protein
VATRPHLRTGEDVQCQHCGRLFYVPRCLVARTQFCSAPCRREGLKARHAATWQDRFWAKVQKGDGCWEWRGPRSPSGYGFGPKFYGTQAAHRLSYIIANGPIPAGMVVMHNCDNPPCVRPDHLSLGTPAENSAEMVARNRSYHGPRPGKTCRGSEVKTSKLTEDKVREMRSLAASGVPNKHLAARYGITPAHAWDVVSGNLWKHIL